MKKIILGLACLTSLSGVMAQTKNVVSAINYLGYYRKDKSVDDLLEAKKYIDEASTNEETKGKPKTWAKRADVYAALSSSQDEKVKGLGINFLDELMNSHKQVLALSTEKDNDYVGAAKSGLYRLAIMFSNNGVEAFNKKEFSSALTSFENSVKIHQEVLQKTDTNGIYYAGVCANELKNFGKAKDYFNQAIASKFGVAYGEDDALRPYYLLSQLYKDEKNEAEYLKTLKAARTAYPNNKNFILEEMNYYVEQGKMPEAIKNIDEAIAKDPANKILYFNKGIMYDKLANPADGKKIDAKLYDEYFSKAIEATTKAIEIDANYFDAQFQMGAFYYNKGVKQNEFANTITGVSAADVKKYELESKKVEASFKQALPYFEKCDAIGNTDKIALKDLYTSLKQIYTYVEMLDKVKAMKAKLDALQN